MIIVGITKCGSNVIKDNIPSPVSFSPINISPVLLITLVLNVDNIKSWTTYKKINNRILVNILNVLFIAEIDKLII